MSSRMVSAYSGCTGGDQEKPKRPVGGRPFSQLEEIDIDFRVPGLSHAVVKEAEIFRVQELVKKIEGHPH